MYIVKYNWVIEKGVKHSWNWEAIHRLSIHSPLRALVTAAAYCVQDIDDYVIK